MIISYSNISVKGKSGFWKMIHHSILGNQQIVEWQCGRTVRSCVSTSPANAIPLFFAARSQYESPLLADQLAGQLSREDQQWSPDLERLSLKRLKHFLTKWNCDLSLSIARPARQAVFPTRVLTVIKVAVKRASVMDGLEAALWTNWFRKHRL
jgi:hypothetical protein